MIECQIDKIVSQAIRRYRWTGVTRDELTGFAMEGFYKAQLTYNPKKQSFKAWSDLKMRWAIVDGLRHDRYLDRRKHKPAKLPKLATIPPVKEFPLAGLDFDALAFVLTPKELRVLKKRYVDGDKVKEIAAEMGVHQSRVCHIHSRALLKLRLGGISEL